MVKAEKEKSMATLAVVGAGPGLGAAVARRFGREGFAIALIARDQAKLRWHWMRWQSQAANLRTKKRER